MDTPTQTIRAYFAKLNFAPEIADIYLALYHQGPQTLSALARHSGVERTRIYRLLGELGQSNLIEAETNYQQGLLKAAPIANLRILISQKEQDLASLKEELGIIEQVLARNSLDTPTTRLQVFEGPEGIRQMLWNTLQAQTPIYAYQFQPLDNYVGGPFMKRWTEEFSKRQIALNIMINPGHSDRESSSIRGIQYNKLNQDIFPITHSCQVYDDVVAYCTWHKGHIFGHQLRNRQVADAQRLLLRRLWGQSGLGTNP